MPEVMYECEMHNGVGACLRKGPLSGCEIGDDNIRSRLLCHISTFDTQAAC